MNSMHSPPAWSMGKSQRGTWKGSGQPGPGTYVATTTHKPRTLGGKWGKDSRDKKRRNSVPGPGSYNSPGKVSTRSPEHGIAGKYPEHLKSRSPGPGAYEGTGQRGYDVTSPSYSFRIKPTENNKQKGPGPGAYENESKVRSTTSPSFKIGSADRDDLYPTSAAPGPGTYATRPQSAYNKDSGPKYPFGSADRDDLYRGNKAPGPGTYDQKGGFDEGKGPTILGKRQDRPQSARNPGPGAYDPTLSHKNQGPSYRIGSAAQRDSPSKEKVPGPGNYDPRLMDSGQKVRIGTSVRSPLHSGQKNPGPGSYDQGTTVGEGPKYSIKARRDSKKNQFVPGPGSYEATSSMQSPSYKIGTSTRDNMHETGFAPGPGAYTTRPKSAYNADSGPKYGFGSADRDEMYSGNKAPGPGSYNHRGAFDDGKGPTIAGRRADRPQSARNPGPGAYDPTLGNKNKSPAFRMGSAPRERGDNRGSGVPGPGNYNADLGRSKIGAKFGSSVRSPLNSTRDNPGPGNYEYASKIGEGPRFSMKPRRDSRGGNAMGPGPGSYEATSGLKSPSYKMGSSTRDGLYKTGDTPGPGSYSNRPDSAGPKFGFGSSVRDPLHGMSKTLPGPGAYDQKGTFDENKGITIAGRRTERNTAKSPGPGAYDPNLAGKNQAPAYGMGTAPRDGFIGNDAPGPGNYDPNLMTGRQSVKIGTSMRSPLSEGKKTPGPGAYEYNPSIGEGPRFSMKPRREDRFDPFVPGPGAYDSTSRIGNLASPSYKIGTSNRDDLYRTGNTPGPGTYGRPDSASGPKYGFGSADRDALHGMSKTLPGPGSYDARTDFGDEGKGVSLVPRRPDSALNAASRSPGPGSYNPKLKGKGPAYGIGTAQRDSPSKDSRAPGPGNYDPRLSQSGHNVKIGTSVRSPLSTSGNNPGPGTYESNARVGEGPRFTMKGRRDDRYDAFVPGPGAYDATSRIQNVASPSYKIGTSNRDDLYRSGNNPGPGTYGRPDSASGPKYGFGSADRDPLHGMSKTMPGPGAYEHMGQFDGDGRGVTMSGRFPERDSTRNPGPGAYNPNLYTKDNAPAYKLGTAQRDSPSKDRAPGPGNYDPRLGQSGQNIRIGTSVRSPLHGNERTPGPGTYESGTRVGEGPKYIMNPRREEKHDKFQPGPGAYEATSRIQNMSSPSYRIGSASRDGQRGNDAPGPGTYNTRPVSAFNKESGPKHVFGSADRDPLHGMSKTMPGPGAYEHMGGFEGDGKGISIAARLPETTSVRSPGPAAYNPNTYTKEQGPAYRMGSAPRDSPSKDRAPGPGKYEPRMVESGKNVRIGTSEREPLHGNTKTPGPGTYDSPTKVGSGPKYIINPRREEKVDRFQPGPGAYNPSVDLVKDNRQVSGKMGSSNRDDFYNTKTSPGPGQYDAREKITGPKWGFGSESRSPIQKPGPPGPGSYEMPPQVGAVPKYAYGNAPLKIQL